MSLDRETAIGAWVDPFIERVEGAVRSGSKIQILDRDGNQVFVVIGQDFLRFLIANRIRLQQVALDTFKSFLSLLSEKKDFEALVVIYAALDNQSLVDKYKEDTIKLAEIAKQSQENRDFWINFAKQAAQRLVFSALGALL
jgi:hypothetical protein